MTVMVDPATSGSISFVISFAQWTVFTKTATVAGTTLTRPVLSNGTKKYMWSPCPASGSPLG
jgi:hypothetical protein